LLLGKFVSGVVRKFSMPRFGSMQSNQRGELASLKAGKFWFVGCSWFALARPFIARPNGVAIV
jgi:hypothetical protein